MSYINWRYVAVQITSVIACHVHRYKMKNAPFFAILRKYESQFEKFQFD